MGHLEFKEATIILVIGLLIYAIPITATIWAIKTLINIRSGQEAIKSRLEAIERAIQSNPPR
jgi:hypothetical protein